MEVLQDSPTRPSLLAPGARELVPPPIQSLGLSGTDAQTCAWLPDNMAPHHPLLRMCLAPNHGLYVVSPPPTNTRAFTTYAQDIAAAAANAARRASVAKFQSLTVTPKKAGPDGNVGNSWNVMVSQQSTCKSSRLYGPRACAQPAGCARRVPRAARGKTSRIPRQRTPIHLTDTPNGGEHHGKGGNADWKQSRDLPACRAEVIFVLTPQGTFCRAMATTSAGTTNLSSNNMRRDPMP